jgi:hypothetical protein
MLIRPTEQEAVSAAFAYRLDHEVVPTAQYLADDLDENGTESDIDDDFGLVVGTADQVGQLFGRLSSQTRPEFFDLDAARKRPETRFFGNMQNGQARLIVLRETHRPCDSGTRFGGWVFYDVKNAVE